MHLVNRNRGGHLIPLRALRHPGLIAPLMLKIPHDRGGSGGISVQKANGSLFSTVY